jgi:hypothetical protein
MGWWFLKGEWAHLLFDFKNILDLQIHSETYLCPFLRQNGGDGLLKGKDNLIPQ